MNRRRDYQEHVSLTFDKRPKVKLMSEDTAISPELALFLLERVGNLSLRRTQPNFMLIKAKNGVDAGSIGEYF